MSPQLHVVELQRLVAECRRVVALLRLVEQEEASTGGLG
jgi:hypothetical protein